MEAVGKFQVRGEVRWHELGRGLGMKSSTWDRWEPQGLDEICSIRVGRCRPGPLPILLLPHPLLDSQLSISADASFPEGPK